MDILGRKLFIQIIFVPFILSWLLITFAKSVSMIYAEIMIQGISGGMSFCVATYIAEICIPHHRGALLSVIEIMYSLGILLSNILMYYFKWNLVAAFFVAISVFGLLMTVLLPESPVWLYSKGKHDKSIAVLRDLRCKELHELDPEIRQMEISCSQTFKTCSKETFRNCLKAWKPFVILSTMFIILLSTGYPIMLAFTVTIVDRLNIPYESSTIAVLFAVSIFTGSLTTPYFMHTFGRKMVLAISGLGMAVSMVIVALYEELAQDNSWSCIVPLALFVYIFACIIGVLPVGFVMGGELFPLEVRGVMNGLYGAAGYVYSSAMMKAYPRFSSLLGIKSILWMFAGFSLLAALFGIFILPETKGKSLNEVQEKYFKKNKKSDVESA
ncbi:facilitated trehalose transporter Tret1-like [Planococcus citri]|uniref:facilitated trehalose transporter Tret1-like n=1 Tax=Planococcus citri TaxID=170843 RepID=UPI0031F7F46D